MTKREMFEAIVNGTINEEIVEMAKGEIAKMDARNARRSAKPSKVAIANEPIKVALSEHLTDEPQVASELAKTVEISTQKASALLRQMVDDGSAKVTDVKVKGRGKMKGYFI